jgi:hypothetical protein
VTVRKTIDVMIATSCVDFDRPLLYADPDPDFDACAEHLGLRPVSG